ncbi:flippase [Paraburkholderia caballeronis]|uniref:Polysaccharide transporter, PST family n=1 Tax=Paraburkholderia caballeronis TaxID=416943 RepID=A0A1H7JVG4_9BURK|nr:flippase [Paraburkholderia caballeronis]PXW27246.1 PST family polysaccharide transporter [Paraburkholderia caballeronis]PXX02720.1 PST family polysaccharide transporter [Paraburkholderia caballeronis]RAK03445.1 PST family polysaccharide transporter [Paraburkholderia caballeronis]TDV17108.1 PST family polysaccharide transporter [Paraburkholderia caballeronis]TDV17493.1 PST family polysaccharide transporter [Paraburkholderia caballeronis]
MSAKKDAAALYVIQICNYVVPLLALPYLTRTLGPDRLGQIGFAQAFIQFFITVADFGFDLTAARKVSINRDDPVERSRLYWTVTLAKSTLAIACAGLIGLLIAFVPALREDRAVILIGLLSLAGTVLNPLWLYQGLERMPKMAVVSLGSRVVCLVPLFLFVRSSDQYLIAAATLFAPLLLSGLYLTAFAHRSGMVASWQRVTWSGIRVQTADAFQIFSGSALTFLYTYANTVVLKFVCGNVAVGYYVTADKLISPIRQLLWPLIQTMYPRVCKLYAEGRALQAEEIFRKITLVVVCFNAAAIVVVYLFGDRLILLFFGARFLPALPVLKVLIFLPLVLAIASVLMQLRLLAQGELRSLKRIYGIGAAFHVAQSIWLVMSLGALGTAISVVLTEIVVTALIWLECRGVSQRHALRKPALGIGDEPA